jgi:hypothetical protein
MTVFELIECLAEMPMDAKVYWWVGDERVEVAEVRDVGDCVDLYETDRGD